MTQDKINCLNVLPKCEHYVHQISVHKFCDQNKIKNLYFVMLVEMIYSNLSPVFSIAKNNQSPKIKIRI
ncbi:hypothetical protein BpHYR1_010206 [Brachionus plicatilis]|uniref:Uncharacterized protein n=1 Tax=Brachionus plicatilis TaxID=10195 RepID=A0A3M7R0T7_BRAPC|nr:hypothetical protein BpHYR1_010206 [Brachionus plicatilis]